MRPLGIRVLLVEPSGFRTDWGAIGKRGQAPIPDYDATPLRRQVEQARTSTTPQAGNPDKRPPRRSTATVVQGGPNLHLPLGAGSFVTTVAKLDRLRTEYASLEAVARAADDQGSVSVDLSHPMKAGSPVRFPEGEGRP